LTAIQEYATIARYFKKRTLKEFSMKRFLQCVAVSLLLITNIIFNTYAENKPKIVGLVTTRLDKPTARQYLQALSLYTDVIVVADSSEENRPSVLDHDFLQKHAIHKIISQSYNSSTQYSDALVSAGRALGGTHFILLQEDEMLCACCKQNNQLRDSLCNLQPGQGLFMHKVQLWRTPRIFMGGSRKKNQTLVAFCDDGVHAPYNLPVSPVQLISATDMVLLDFKATNWATIPTEQAWYRCHTHIKHPYLTTNFINNLEKIGIKKMKAQTLDPSKKTYRSHDEWFAYDFYDEKVFQTSHLALQQELLDLIDRFGIDFF